ncbi:sensor histidine kinase [Saccharothrix xinjiangensis]|uniref:histidine kinase n=1 Tax=Saccharothrix xinjiangensis TaxID=204798 RepID=A0ABV9YBK8_9PSEU
MRNGVALAVLAIACLGNGLAMDALPVWRQLLFVVLAVLAYLHGRHLPVRHGGVVLAAVGAVGVVIAAVWFWEGFGALACLGLFVALPRLIGLFRAQQADLVEAGRQRIDRLEREREWVAERARLRERGRIAADVHDSLGHELALIALRAGALELTADTERGREAAAELRKSAVTATDRLRQAIGVLREGAAPVEPPDEDVAELVSRARCAGLQVTLIGSPGPLPALVDRAVHRVVREALTNAARHAPGAPVAVRTTRHAAEVVVTVENPLDDTWPSSPNNSRPDDRRPDDDQAGGAEAGEARPAESTGRPTRREPSQRGASEHGSSERGLVGSGSGLAELTERLRLLGGTLRSSATGGRFTVTAHLPIDKSTVERVR